MRRGVRVGPGSCMPRLPALYKPKRNWRLLDQEDPLDYVEQNQDSDITWRRNCTSLNELTDKAMDVLRDQAETGQ